MACRQCEEARAALKRAGSAILKGDLATAKAEARVATGEVSKKITSSQDRIRRLTSR